MTREMIPKPKACAKCKAVWYCSKGAISLEAS